MNQSALKGNATKGAEICAVLPLTESVTKCHEFPFKTFFYLVKCKNKVNGNYFPQSIEKNALL